MSSLTLCEKENFYFFSITKSDYKKYVFGCREQERLSVFIKFEGK